MSRLLERETSPPSYSYRADTLSPFVPRLLEKERERERETGEEGGRGQRRCFARFSSEKRIVFECSTNVSVFCLFDGVAWTVCGYRRGQNPSFTIFLTAIPAVSRSRGSHSGKSSDAARNRRPSFLRRRGRRLVGIGRNGRRDARFLPVVS